jgi:hypothetical protein
MDEQLGQRLYLLTVARGCVDEPHIYGPLRLVDAISRIVDIASQVSVLQDPFLIDLKRLSMRIST